jgi:cbb3-type cytochrome oxidase subunit 3
MTTPVSIKFIAVASLIVLFVAYLLYLFIEPRLEFRQAKNEVTALQQDCQNHVISFSQYMDRIEALAEDHDYSMAYIAAILMNHSFGEYVRSRRDDGKISGDEYARYMKLKQKISEAAGRRNQAD